MLWPSPTDFNEAVQSPPSAFSDDELRRAEPVTDAVGLIRPYSGNFADVYQLRGEGEQFWAVKCFTRAVPQLQQRYQAISDHLQQGHLPFMVHFRYLAEGIRIRGQWYPVVKMPWIQGFTLNQFVRDNLDKPALLDRLAKMWLRLAQQLRGVGAAHADLQHGNVILVPNAKTGGLSLRLIDYDGMYVPSLANSPSGEVGHPNYQHPQRLREAVYNSEIDRFSHLVIYTALRCLALPGGRALWERFDNSENLLFREQDFAAPRQSALFRALWQSQKTATRTLVGHLLLATQSQLTAVPLLDDLVNDGLTEPLTADQDQKVQQLLSEAAPPVAAAVPVQAAPVQAVPVTPAMLVEPVAGVLVDVFDTVAGPPMSTKPVAAKPTTAKPALTKSALAKSAAEVVPVAIPLGVPGRRPPAPPDSKSRQANSPRLPRKRPTPASPPSVDWKATLGPGAVVAGVIALGLLLMILISVIVLLTMPPSSNSNRPNDPVKPKDDPPPTPDTTPAIGKETQRFAWPHAVTCLCVSADGKQLLTGSDEPWPRVRVYDTNNGQLLQSFFGPKSAIRAVARSPHGDHVLAVADGSVYVWEVETGRLLYKLPQSGVSCVAVSPDGQLALSGSADGLLHRWNLVAPKDKPFSFSHPGAARQIAFGPRNDLAVTAGADGLVRLWNVQSGKETNRFTGHQGELLCVAISENGKRVLSGGADGTLRLWNAETGKELKKMLGRKGSVRALSMTADATLAAAATATEVRIWDLNTGQATHRLEGHTKAVNGVAALPTHNAVLTGGADKSLRMWPLRPGIAPVGLPPPTPPEAPPKDGVEYVAQLNRLLEHTLNATLAVRDRPSASKARQELALLAERWTQFASVPQPPLDRNSNALKEPLALHAEGLRLRDNEAARLVNLPDGSAALAVLNLHDGKLK